MELAKTLKEMALKYASENRLAVHGEIVSTVWGDWKKPHKVQINSIGAGLSLRRKDFRLDKIQPEFGMTYCAIRFFADGRPRDKEGGGIVLTNFKRGDGTTWTETHEVINHYAYTWELPKTYKRKP